MALASDDTVRTRIDKLLAGGALNYALRDNCDGIVHACSTCIDCERQWRFCNLLELMLPVEPQWPCIVWRV